ncbi:hypothetical protein P3T76_007808 [Phytophthora citrophthora]|uniref:RxLR effector protein n=1 Tax=Phytophthora citrophthora TaxID=4793 RepID=A0AAD9GM54_9STRA|nr:hypothetical protein P3T76_007808 [Phytophthora citrophthora]
MRVHCLVLLAVAVVFATDAVTARSLPEEQSVSRFLRTHKTTKTNNEERVNLLGFEVKIGLLDDMIEKAKLSPTFNELLKTNGNAEKAFKAFKVDDVVDDVFQSTQWKEWAEYVKYVAAKKGENVDEELARAMSVAYKPDGLSKMLATAVKNPKSKEIALMLENAQQSRWIKGKFTPEAIFKTLNLHKADNIFDTPQFATWTNFLKAYNKENPEKAMTEFNVLSSAYGELNFAKMLGSADDSPPAQAMKKELVQSWIDGATHPINMFSRLKLNEADDLLTNPVLNMWVRYMKEFNELYPKQGTTMIKTFTQSYGDEKVALMILEASKSSDDKVVEFAKNLQSAQINQWMVDKKTPKEMLTVLGINSQTLSENPLGSVWRAYNKEYTKKMADGDFAFQP